MTKNKHTEISGRDAIARRDALENFITARFPGSLQAVMSAVLTSITGLAPSTRAGRPVWAGSVLRSVVYMLVALVAGFLLLMCASPVVKLIGVMGVVFAMRSFSSAVGHQLTHSSKGLPWNARWTQMGYDVVSALLLLPSFERYAWVHGGHHGKVGGPGDPDQELLETLGARLNGFWPFFGTLLNPVLHWRFLAERLGAVFGKRPTALIKPGNDASHDPVWRRRLAVLALLSALLLPVPSLFAWWATLVFGYQVASLLSMISLHLWWQRPASGKGVELASAVTFARLLIPEATWGGVLLLPLYALVRVLWLQGDLGPGHDLHHAYGTKYPWTEAAYVRTRLLLEGVPLRQTVSVRAMFRVAFDSAAGSGKLGLGNRT